MRQCRLRVLRTAGKQPPFVGKVLSIERLGGRDKERDVSHIVIDTGGVPYVEGQSFGVVPPVGVFTRVHAVVQLHVKALSALAAGAQYAQGANKAASMQCNRM